MKGARVIKTQTKKPILPVQKPGAPAFVCAGQHVERTLGKSGNKKSAGTVLRSPDLGTEADLPTASDDRYEAWKQKVRTELNIPRTPTGKADFKNPNEIRTTDKYTFDEADGTEEEYAKTVQFQFPPAKPIKKFNPRWRVGFKGKMLIFPVHPKDSYLYYQFRHRLPPKQTGLYRTMNQGERFKNAPTGRSFPTGRSYVEYLTAKKEQSDPTSAAMPGASLPSLPIPHGIPWDYEGHPTDRSRTSKTIKFQSTNWKPCGQYGTVSDTIPKVEKKGSRKKPCSILKNSGCYPSKYMSYRSNSLFCSSGSNYYRNIIQQACRTEKASFPQGLTASLARRHEQGQYAPCCGTDVPQKYEVLCGDEVSDYDTDESGTSTSLQNVSESGKGTHRIYTRLPGDDTHLDRGAGCILPKIDELEYAHLDNSKLEKIVKSGQNSTDLRGGSQSADCRGFVWNDRYQTDSADLDHDPPFRDISVRRNKSAIIIIPTGETEDKHVPVNTCFQANTVEGPSAPTCNPSNNTDHADKSSSKKRMTPKVAETVESRRSALANNQAQSENVCDTESCMKSADTHSNGGCLPPLNSEDDDLFTCLKFNLTDTTEIGPQVKLPSMPSIGLKTRTTTERCQKEEKEVLQNTPRQFLTPNRDIVINDKTSFEKLSKRIGLWDPTPAGTYSSRRAEYEHMQQTESFASKRAGHTRSRANFETHSNEIGCEFPLYLGTSSPRIETEHIKPVENCTSREIEYRFSRPMENSFKGGKDPYAKPVASWDAKDALTRDVSSQGLPGFPSIFKNPKESATSTGGYYCMGDFVRTCNILDMKDKNRTSSMSFENMPFADNSLPYHFQEEEPESFHKRLRWAPSPAGMRERPSSAGLYDTASEFLHHDMFDSYHTPLPSPTSDTYIRYMPTAGEWGTSRRMRNKPLRPLPRLDLNADVEDETPAAMAPRYGFVGCAAARRRFLLYGEMGRRARFSDSISNSEKTRSIKSQSSVAFGRTVNKDKAEIGGQSGSAATESSGQNQQDVTEVIESVKQSVIESQRARPALSKTKGAPRSYARKLGEIRNPTRLDRDKNLEVELLGICWSTRGRMMPYDSPVARAAATVKRLAAASFLSLHLPSCK